MKTLLEQTQETLKANGKTVDDIKLVVAGKQKLDTDIFIDIMTCLINADSREHGHVNDELIIYGSHWRLVRGHDEMNQWWEFEKLA